jgi:hypothetical protein
VRLTVRASDNSTDQTQINVNPNSPGLTATIRIPEGIATAFTSFLRFPTATGRVEGRLVLNGTSVVVTDNRAPYAHRVRGRNGWNTIEAVLTWPSKRAGNWRFDFASSEHFEAGSIHVENGVVVSLDSHSVVLRMSGAPSERVRFKYRLSP